MEINYIKSGITLFLALTISSLTVDGVRAYFASQVIAEAANSLKIHNKKSERERISKAQRQRLEDIDKHNRAVEASKKQKASNIKLKSQRKTNNETCSYWTKQYSKIKSKYRKEMKKSSCNRARND